MWKDKITLRVQTRFRKLKADHSIPLLQKCKQAREILTEIYADRELCITENLINRFGYLKQWRPWRSDMFYTGAFELAIIHGRLEGMIASLETRPPSPPAAEESSVPASDPGDEPALEEAGETEEENPLDIAGV